MKFLHISDLHLGRHINNFSLIENQKDILNQIVQIVKDNNIQAVLIAGDIYDRSLPSVDAIKLLNKFLESFLELNISLYIVSGNHDSVDRLSFGSEIFRNENIYISHPYDGTIQKETIYDEFGEINIYLMPFVNTINIKSVYKDLEDASSLTEAFEYVLSNANIDTSKRNIFVGHQYVINAPKDKELPEKLGGTPSIDANIFTRWFDYIALGHIHKSYWVIDGKVRYCGSPLQYSVDESNNQNSVTIIDFKSKGEVLFEKVKLNPKRRVRRLRGTFKDITENLIDTQDYLEVTLTDEDYIENVMARLRDKYPNVIQLAFENSRTKTFKTFKTSANDVENKSLLNLFSDFYNNIYEVKIEENPDYIQILEEVYQDLEVSYSRD